MKESVLGLNKKHISVENTFNLDHFEINGSHGSNKEEKYLFYNFLQVCD